MNRNWLISITAAATLAAAGSVSAQTIANTEHDLSTVNNGDGGRICVYCHTPHNSDQAVAPLWNHVNTTSGFTMYSSPTLDMDIANSPAGVSLACLSCHDGTVATDDIVNVPKGLTWATPSGSIGGGLLGTDLSNDHPISLTYDNTATGDTDFVDAATVKLTIPLFVSLNGVDQVECGSCHSVHDDSIPPFLRVDNADSAMCLTCHVK